MSDETKDLADLTPLQAKCVEALRRTPHIGADSIAHWLKLRPVGKHRLAVTSALYALQRKGLVYRYPPKDRWDHARWGLLNPK